MHAGLLPGWTPATARMLSSEVEAKLASDDATRFLLVEIYRTAEAPAAHKATAHYAAWRDAVESMMAEPRRSVKYRALAPADERWEYPR